jgi:hypothetical protein
MFARAFAFQTALLRKSACGMESPPPIGIYARGTVIGIPSAV